MCCSDSLWLHVRASGHWTRRVYELFRTKLKQEHGTIANDFNDLRLRSSMRSRMSKSYIDELRGVSQQGHLSQLDMNNNTHSNRSSHCSISTAQHHIPMKSHSISFPANKVVCVSCRSTLSLRDIQLDPIDENPHGFDENNRSELRSLSKTIIINPSELDNLTVEDIEKIDEEKDVIITDIAPRKPVTILKPAIKNQHRLTVPTVGDFCIRIPERSSIGDGGLHPQQHVEIHETRLSDALGYLRMYKNQNRIQFNSLQCNDREDLQVTRTKLFEGKYPLCRHQVLIDGPYGAPSQHIFDAEHAVLIAAGIGITPFASILQSIMCRYRNRRHKCPNCEHIWTNRESEELCVKKVSCCSFLLDCIGVDRTRWISFG